MTTETIKLQVDNSQALRGLNQVNQASDKLNATLGILRNALGALALGNIVRQTLDFANAIQDLSNATGIASTTILAFSNAVSTNGGNAEKAQAAINKLVLSIGEAADGSKKAQVAFSEVGVSLEDLQYLSEQEIFQKTVNGIAKIEDVAKRTRIQSELLGKSLRGVNISGVAGALPGLTRPQDAKAIADAAAASEKLIEGMNNLRTALIGIIQPFAELISSLDLSVESMKALIYAFISFGAAVAAVKLQKFITEILVVALYTDRLTKLMRLLGTAMLFVGGTFARIILPVVAVVTALEAISRIFFKFSIIDWVIDKFKSLAKEIKEFLGFKDDLSKPLKIGEGGQAAPEGFASLKEYFEKTRERRTQAAREVEDAFEKERKSIRAVTEAYKDQNAQTLVGLQRQLRALGISENLVEIESARNDILDNAADKIRELTEKQKNLTGEDLKYWGVIQQQIDAIKTYSEVYADASEEIVKQIQARRLEEEKALLVTERLQQQLESDTSLQQLRDQIELIGLMGEELEDARLILEVSQELENKLLELRRSELDLLAKRAQLSEEQFQMELEHINALREAASQYANDRLTIERELIEKQRALQNDWQATIKEQLKELADSITPARLAADLFGSVISSIDNALTQFVENGKFNFKDFTRSLLRDMAMIVARAMVMRAILGAVGMIFPGATTGLSALLNATPMRAGGPVSASNPYLVGEAGPELFMPRTAGTIIPNNQLGMMGGATTVNYNIQAVDASSFRSLVARDPSFIYNVTEVGRRSSPNRRLA